MSGKDGDGSRLSGRLKKDGTPAKKPGNKPTPPGKRRPSTSKTAPRIVISLDRELQAMELRKAHFSFHEIAVQLNIGKTTAKHLVDRAMARIEDDCKDEARELKRMMIERYKTTMGVIYKKAAAGDVQAIDRMMKLDQALCELVSIRRFKQETIEIGGPGGGPIPISSAVTSLDAMSYDERVKMLHEMSGEAGPPPCGYYIQPAGPRSLTSDVDAPRPPVMPGPPPTSPGPPPPAGY